MELNNITCILAIQGMNNEHKYAHDCLNEYISSGELAAGMQNGEIRYFLIFEHENGKDIVECNKNDQYNCKVSLHVFNNISQDDLNYIYNLMKNSFSVDIVKFSTLVKPKNDYCSIEYILEYSGSNNVIKCLEGAVHADFLAAGMKINEERYFTIEENKENRTNTIHECKEDEQYACKIKMHMHAVNVHQNKYKKGIIIKPDVLQHKKRTYFGINKK